VFLQPESGVAFLDEQERITLIVGGQWAHEDQEQVAHALNLPLEKIRIIYPAIGGAFGGREDMSVQIVLALAVMKLEEQGIRRPVKIIWSREESIIGHHKRHAYTIKSKWGASKEGKIIAADIKILADGGAYAYTSTKVLGNATLLATGPYEIPNVSVDAYVIYTNNIPGGAFRGFGGPQAAFQAEMQINTLAEKLNMDPIEFRFRNLYQEDSLMSVGTKIPKGVSIREVASVCANKAGWKKSKIGWVRSSIKSDSNEISGIRKGIGFACGYKNIGFSFGAQENCNARIELYGQEEIEKAILYHAGAEVGQGAHTVFKQITADALGIPIAKIELVLSDTSTSGNSGSVSASRMTFMAGNAIIGASKQALANWNNNKRPAIGDFTYIPPKTSPFDPETGHCFPNFAYGYVAEAVELEVNTNTGEIYINNVICVNDIGKAINPQQVEGQIEGGIVQAFGYSNLENFIQENGYVKTSTLSTYLIPTVLDIPKKIDSLQLEFADPIGPMGARGMGEMPFLPFAPAVMDAIHDAIGKWFFEFPITPEKILKKLGKIK
jgi:CO/xanthine dehydrogenase Mo-binding subunit